MTTIDLIRSLKSQAKWGQNATDGRPYRGVKWLTSKQVNFLQYLCEKEDLWHFTEGIWDVDGYKVTIGRRAPNGCASMLFINMNGN